MALAPWPPIVNDDGSGTNGTVVDVALFNAIKAYIDGLASPTWIDFSPSVTTAAGGGVTGTIVLSRYTRLTPTTVLMQLAVSPLGIPSPTGYIRVAGLPFSITDVHQYNAVARIELPKAGVPTEMSIYRMDTSNYPAGPLNLFLSATFRVVAG